MAAPTQPELMTKSLTVARIYFQKHLQEPAAQQYLKERGFSKDSIRQFEVGYAPDNWRGLVDHFTSHPVRLAGKAAGVITTLKNSDRMIDMFRDRLIFPIRNDAGELVGYGGRLLGEKEGSPKYINTPETPLFQKSQLLYGLHQHKADIAARREALVVEGYVDVITTSAAGLGISVAPMGTALTGEQVQLLMGLGVRKIWLCLDGDAAGQSAAERNLAVIMQHYHPSLDIRIVLLPDGDDPDSLIRKQGKKSLEALMADALALPQYIDSLCRKGLPDKLGLEDKACYLVAMEQYLDMASGALQDALLAQSCAVTGLKSEQIASGKYQRQQDNAVAEWHPLVALAARWMWHDDNAEVAQRLQRSQAQGKGMRELTALSKLKLGLGGDSDCQMMLAFVKSHGPLLDAEFQQLTRQWPQWRRKLSVEEGIQTLRERPYDRSAAKMIRAALRM
ncbi:MULTISPECIES: DNA primase [Ectopseudomonas]|jgi:DNA primase|uniref:DNA primase n=2 Tax=Ectopseudomonas TaxID=3236654 RepID=A0A1G6Q9Q3_9GAMM|nr:MULTISPECIES: toprim domain-containing protein [Pseudomonas]ALN21703.1 hypothetical protein DW68_023765 [Pseudomonas mendocina S5.2]MBP3062125.1 toprim domain-containing protein [Pseudomonas chengduensis]NNB75417.1 toprim domain-containing protein [Pseudomonas chengduensis]OEO24329.1 hypothetical protein AX279_16795 [Pseudomonas sp. J237]CRN64510.1 DNA primase [Pseudomonas aeruginosa]